MSHIPIIWQYVTNYILETSSISLGEMAQLTGNYLCIVRGEKNDSEVLRARGFKEDQIKTALRNKKTTPIEILGLKFTSTLTAFIYPQLSYILTLFENYERGVLPFQGPLTEQPAKIIEIFNVIRAIKNTLENKQRDQSDHGR